MNNIGKNSFDIGYMDTLAEGDSPLHRLDPRAKLITTLIFIVTVVSFDKYSVPELLPFFAYPMVLIAMGGLPPGYILKKALLVSPFAVLVGIFNPVIDREIFFHIGSVGISGGWISFVSILLRFLLTVTAALILISLTGFNAVSRSLIKLRVPRPFVVQLLFFYRYIFVLVDEAERMARARSLRVFRSGAMGISTFVPLVGHLLLRTLGRAERVYNAMRCRGFDGNIRVIRPSRIGVGDIIFTAVWSFLFISFRYFDIPARLGSLVIEAFG
jgi:cobalt/nickel transport system permease protein